MVVLELPNDKDKKGKLKEDRVEVSAQFASAESSKLALEVYLGSRSIASYNRALDRLNNKSE